MTKKLKNYYLSSRISFPTTFHLIFFQFYLVFPTLCICIHCMAIWLQLRIKQKIKYIQNLSIDLFFMFFFQHVLWLFTVVKVPIIIFLSFRHAKLYLKWTSHLSHILSSFLSNFFRFFFVVEYLILSILTLLHSDWISQLSISLEKYTFSE